MEFIKVGEKPYWKRVLQNEFFQSWIVRIRKHSPFVSAEKNGFACFSRVFCKALKKILTINNFRPINLYSY